MPRPWERLRTQYDRLRFGAAHLWRDLPLSRELRRLLTPDLHPEVTAYHEQLDQQIDRLLLEPSTRPLLHNLDVRISEPELIDSVALAAGLDRAQAYVTITAVFGLLRDRLTYRECEHIARWLPPKLRRWIVKPRRQGALTLGRAEFIDRLCRHLGVDIAQALLRIRAVYGVLERALGVVAPLEPTQLLALIPPELRAVVKAPPRPCAAADPPPQAS